MSMTESEAKKFMLIEKECINRDCDRDCANCDIVQKVEDLNNAYDIAIKSIEKQIPKKPILKSGESLVHINKGDKPHEWKLNKWCSWCCPVCGWFVGERYNRVRNDGSIHPHDQRKSNYCNECGQAIDWSDGKR